MIDIFFEDNLDAMAKMPDESFDFVYLDPPFNTGKLRELGKYSYSDHFRDDYIDFMEKRILHAHRLLSSNGSLFFHIDYRESHYVKVSLDRFFGRGAFMNEIIWSYDYGGRSKTRWPAKHDTIFWYAKDKKNYTFNYDNIDRIPYMAPGLVGAEKAAKGKTPTDVWWSTIVPTNGREKTGYPTQKPVKIIERMINVHTNPGDRVLDPFAGSGTTGEVCESNGRDSVMIDNNEASIEVMCQRFDSMDYRIMTKNYIKKEPVSI